MAARDDVLFEVFRPDNSAPHMIVAEAGEQMTMASLEELV